MHNFPSCLGIRLVSFSIVVFTREYLIYSHKLKWILVSQTAYHRAIQSILNTYFITISHIFQSSVDLESQTWEILLKAIDSIVHQRRDRPILSRVEPFQKCFPGMDYKMSDWSFALVGNLSHEFFGELISVKLINSKSAFNSARNRHCLSHGFHAFSNQFRLFH